MLLKAIASLSAVRITVGLTQVVSPLIVIRFLSQEEFGLYQGFVAITAVLVVIASLGFDASISYFLPKAAANEKRVLGDTTLVVVVTSVCVVLLFLTSAQVGLSSRGEWTFLLQCSAYVLLFANLNWIENYLIVKKRMRDVAAYAITRLAVRISAVLGSAYYFRNAESVIWASIVVELFRFIIACIWVSRRSLLEFPARPSALIAQARYAVPIGLAAICQALSQHAGKILVLTISGPNVLALYAIGVYLQMIVRTIKVGIQDAVFPEMARKAKNRSRLLDLHKKSTVLQYAMFVTLFVLLNCRAEECIRLLFPPQYIEAVAVVQIFSFLLLRRAFNFDSLFRATGISMPALSGSVAGLVANAFITGFLWQFVGWFAAAIGYVLSQVLTEIFYFRCARSILKARLTDLVDIVNLAKCSLSALLSGGMLVVTGVLFGKSAGLLIFESVLYVAATIALMQLLGVKIVEYGVRRVIRLLRET